MAYTVARIANCRRASIRKAPWIPLRQDELVGIRDGPIKKDNTVTKGQTIEIDLDNICYDWTGRKFYKVRHPEGWIYEGCVSIGDDGG